MSQTIKRKGASAGRAAARQGTARKINAAQARTGSMFDRMMAVLPFSETQLQRIFLFLILGAAIALAWAVASAAGVPAMAAAQVAVLAQKAGFQVDRVEVRGVKHLNELKIYEQVLAERNHAMTKVDLGALRTQLMRLSWVQDARVSRQLPNTLIVDIVERKPHAVLRQGDRLVLIDETGHVLEPVAPNRVAGQMVLSGDGVDSQVPALSRLLEAAPALQPQVAAAEWKGFRRWNLTFRTQQVLYLPEGEAEAANALIAFARMDGANRLLGGRAVAFDMRAPDRIYIRIPGHGAEIAAAAKNKLAIANGHPPAPTVHSSSAASGTSHLQENR
jgi:cell division protein FtsQ